MKQKVKEIDKEIFENDRKCQSGKFEHIGMFLDTVFN